MSRSDKSGILLIDKESGWTSHDVVARLRTITGRRKIGHAGTLDPFATGLLVCLVGKATKLSADLVGQEKEYEGEMTLGEISTTGDPEGKVTRHQGMKVSQKELLRAMENFVGKISQIPPMYSAKKIVGQKLYHLARQGREVFRPAREVLIPKFKLNKYSYPRLDFVVRCSSGTYIRVLAEDLGKRIGCGAYLSKLRRLKSGNYRISQGVKISNLSPINWVDYLR